MILLTSFSNHIARFPTPQTRILQPQSEKFPRLVLGGASRAEQAMSAGNVIRSDSATSVCEEIGYIEQVE